MTGNSANYGTVLVNTTVVQSFVVSNTGQQASGPLALAMSGTNGTLWTIDPASGCALGQPLAGLGSCTVAVRFVSPTAGSKAGTLTASAPFTTPGTLNLSARAANPAQLSGAASNAFGAIEVGTSSTTFNWVITNTGDVNTGTIAPVSNANSQFFVVSDGCANQVLTPGSGSCTVQVQYRPTVGGTQTGQLQVAATPGNTATLMMTGRGQWRLTIVASFSGGSVSTTDGVISNCVASSGCSALFDHLANVTVHASPLPGSGMHLVGFVAPASCSAYGTGRDCGVTLTSHLSVNARFGPTLENVIFVSSVAYPATLGGVAPYDSRCAALADAAGLVSPQGWTAWMSTLSFPVMTRLGSGWGAYRNVAGDLVALSQATLFNDLIRLPVDLDEYGTLVRAPVWTGSFPNGQPNGMDCGSWGSPALNVDVGVSSGGPTRWTTGYTGPEAISCSGLARIYCLARGSSAPGTQPSVPTGAKLAYVTSQSTGANGGRANLDAWCNLGSNKPMGFGTRNFVAFVSTTAEPAGARITTPSAAYYRADGVYLGTGAQLAAGTPQAGIWYANGYIGGEARAWTGASRPSVNGSANSTCNDWAGGLQATVGRVSSAATDFFSVESLPCGSMLRLYCIEP